MKKKAEEKKEIVPILKPELYWQYAPSSPDILDKLDAFFLNYHAELKAIITQDKSFQENYEAICERVGCNVHPCLARKPHEESHFPTLKNAQNSEKYLVFMSHKIDALTLRIVGFVAGVQKIESIKFTNNQLEKEADEVRRIFEKDDSLKTIYFEWNPLLEVGNRQDIFLSAVRPTIQHLILRECRMGDPICRDLLRKLKEIPNGDLKSLDLYGNSLTNQLAKDISLFVEQSKTLEFLGLSKNGFNGQDFLNKLFSSIGEIPLSEQDEEQQKLKEKARDEVIERNKKRKKGAPEEPLPFVFEIKETQAGRCYVKNTTLTALNLASNDIKDGAVPLIKHFIDNQGKNIEVFLEGNKFSKAGRKRFEQCPNLII